MSEAAKIADMVIEASQDSGPIRAYFLRSVEDNNWEGKQRQAFQRLRNALHANAKAARQQAADLLWQLRNAYRVQFFPTAGRDGFVQVVLEALDGRGWPVRDPPALLKGGNGAVEEIFEFCHRAG